MLEAWDVRPQITVSHLSNTVQLWMFDQYVRIIMINPYFGMIYTFDMASVFFVKRCEESTGSRPTEICHFYQYFTWQDVFGQIDAMTIPGIPS